MPRAPHPDLGDRHPLSPRLTGSAAGHGRRPSPDLTLRGHVDSIQAGSSARFSLLPPENATGNYVKVVQRVPVKIVFDERAREDYQLGPGMSVVPTVRIR